MSIWSCFRFDCFRTVAVSILPFLVVCMHSLGVYLLGISV